MVSNIATYNLHGGGLDARIAPSVDCTIKRKIKCCVGFIKRIFKRSKANIGWLTVYVNANAAKLPYETNKNEQTFIVPHITEKE
eukprot:14018818-Ditylum_brightwellii.AAC.1